MSLKSKAIQELKNQLPDDLIEDLQIAIELDKFVFTYSLHHLDHLIWVLENHSVDELFNFTENGEVKEALLRIVELGKKDLIQHFHEVDDLTCYELIHLKLIKVSDDMKEVLIENIQQYTLNELDVLDQDMKDLYDRREKIKPSTLFNEGWKHMLAAIYLKRKDVCQNLLEISKPFASINQHLSIIYAKYQDNLN